MEFVLTGIITEFWASKKDGAHNITVLGESGEFRFRSKGVDLSQLPKMKLIEFKGRVNGRVWNNESGKSQSLEIVDLRPKLVGAPA